MDPNEPNPYEQKAREIKAGRIVTAALLSTRKAALVKANTDPSIVYRLRGEHAAQVGTLLGYLTGKHGTSLAMEWRDSLLKDAHVKGASPETWKIVHALLAENYANLALDLTEDPFEGLP